VWCFAHISRDVFVVQLDLFDFICGFYGVLM
jgi:hypothetical protein